MLSSWGVVGALPMTNWPCSSTTITSVIVPPASHAMRYRGMLSPPSIRRGPRLPPAAVPLAALSTTTFRSAASRSLRPSAEQPPEEAADRGPERLQDQRHDADWVPFAGAGRE